MSSSSSSLSVGAEVFGQAGGSTNAEDAAVVAAATERAVNQAELGNDAYVDVVNPVNSTKDAPCAGGSNVNAVDGRTSSPLAVAKGPKLEFIRGFSSASSSNESDDDDGHDAGGIYQFHVALCDIKPRIWRRILVPRSYTFDQLHGVIQQAFDWRGHHLHEFRFGGALGRSRLIIRPREDEDEDDDDDEDGFMGFGFNKDSKEDSRTTKLKHFFCRQGVRAKYVYDFGDNWEHQIMLEKILPCEEGKEYPLCIKGKNRAPPEDCGGVYGFEELVAGYKKPAAQRTDEEKDTIAWVEEHYENYDPYKFKPEELTLSGAWF